MKIHSAVRHEIRRFQVSLNAGEALGDHASNLRTENLERTTPAGPGRSREVTLMFDLSKTGPVEGIDSHLSVRMQLRPEPVPELK